MTKTIFFPGFSVLCPEGWQNLADSLNDEDQPFTLADPDNGLGALQFSPAVYRSGPVPSPSADDLSLMVLEFAQTRALGKPLSTHTFSDGVTAAAAEFHADGDFVALWFVTDGKNLLLITYVCDWESRTVEMEERETIVRSVRFDGQLS